MTDSISDFIAKLMNAGKAGKPNFTFPHSKLVVALLEAMEKAKQIESFSKKGKKVNKCLEVKIAYKNNSSKIKGMRRLSKPSRRLYLRANQIKPVKMGYGMMFLSTPKGVLTDKEARKEHVGGEPIAEIW